MASFGVTPPRKQRKLRQTLTDEALSDPAPRRSKLSTDASFEASKAPHVLPTSCSEVIQSTPSKQQQCLGQTTTDEELRASHGKGPSEDVFKAKPCRSEASSRHDETSSVSSHDEVALVDSAQGRLPKYRKLCRDDEEWAEQLPLFERAMFLEEARRSRSRTPPFCREGRKSLPKVEPEKCKSWLAGNEETVPATQERRFLSSFLQFDDREPRLPTPAVLADNDERLETAEDLSADATKSSYKEDHVLVASPIAWRAADRTFREVLPGQRKRYLQWQRST